MRASKSVSVNVSFYTLSLRRRKEVGEYKIMQLFQVTLLGTFFRSWENRAKVAEDNVVWWWQWLQWGGVSVSIILALLVDFGTSLSLTSGIPSS